MKREKVNLMNCRIIPSAALLMLILNTAGAQSSTETRSYTKSFPVNKETSLEVINKYGTIHTTSWKKDSVYIKAEVKAVATSQEKLSDMFDGLSVSITGTGTLIRAQTLFEQNFNRIFEGFKGMTSKIISYDSKVEINYYLNIPEYLNLKIDNKYGDVYMEDCSGKVSLSLSNGSLKAGSIGNESSITISFCDAVINSIPSGKIDASFSEISLENAGNLSITSISSKYDINKAANINFESRRDKFIFNEINSMTGSSYFTNFNIEKLDKEISLETRYGDLIVGLIAGGFESVSLNSGYTDISLHFDENASYDLNIRHMNTFLTLPSKNIKTEEKIIDEERKEYITFGTVGARKGGAKVKIDATRGKIYIK